MYCVLPSKTRPRSEKSIGGLRKPQKEVRSIVAREKGSLTYKIRVGYSNLALTHNTM